jgi:hypothetical protein
MSRDIKKNFWFADIKLYLFAYFLIFLFRSNHGFKILNVCFVIIDIDTVFYLAPPQWGKSPPPRVSLTPPRSEISHFPHWGECEISSWQPGSRSRLRPRGPSLQIFQISIDFCSICFIDPWKKILLIRVQNWIMNTRVIQDLLNIHSVEYVLTDWFNLIICLTQRWRIWRELGYPT